MAERSKKELLTCFHIYLASCDLFIAFFFLHGRLFDPNNSCKVGKGMPHFLNTKSGLCLFVCIACIWGHVCVLCQSAFNSYLTFLISEKNEIHRNMIIIGD